jgi:hypothetical protein
LLLASYVFYAAWDWRFLGLIWLSTVIDYTVGLALERSSAPRRRRWLVTGSIAANLSILGAFKYAGFFADGLRDLAGLAGLELSRLSPLDARRHRQLIEERERFFAGGGLGGLWLDAQRLRSITRGDHAEIQMTLARRAVGRLRAAGAGVIIVEGPLSPMAAEYYDPTIRDDFVAFARSLALEPGVRFVPLKVSATYPEEEFTDFSHLNEAGARKLTAVILRAVREVLEERS